MITRRRPAPICRGVLSAVLGLAGTVSAQAPVSSGGPLDPAPEGSTPVQWSHGFAAVSIELLRTGGWNVILGGDSATARSPEGTVLRARAGSPFVGRDEELLQLADAPYRRDGAFFVPLQLLRELAGEPATLSASANLEAESAVEVYLRGGTVRGEIRGAKVTEK